MCYKTINFFLVRDAFINDQTNLGIVPNHTYSKIQYSQKRFIHFTITFKSKLENIICLYTFLN